MRAYRKRPAAKATRLIAGSLLRRHRWIQRASGIVRRVQKGQALEKGGIMSSGKWYSARGLALALAAGGIALGAPAMAQVQSVDPDRALNGDLMPSAGSPAHQPVEAPPSVAPAPQPLPPETPPAGAPPQSLAAGQQSATYHKDDLIGAAEGVFGKGAHGIASVIEDILRKQGEPNGYIVGREGGGAIGVGLRYGSGTLHHKIEGQRAVYWTGPSIGFDAGASAGSTFVLVYNLYNTDDLYKRFPAGEGQAYFIGGFHVSYMRAGDIVLIPVRMGVGLRLGVNAGYMKFSRKQKWIPF